MAMTLKDFLQIAIKDIEEATRGHHVEVSFSVGAGDGTDANGKPAVVVTKTADIAFNLEVAAAVKGQPE